MQNESLSHAIHANEQEGFERALNLEPGVAPFCSTAFGTESVWQLCDPQGNLLGPEGPGCKLPAFAQRTFLEWETSPAREKTETWFTWLGGSLVRPLRPAFPPVLATLSVNGTPKFQFPLGVLQFRAGDPEDAAGLMLEFDARRYQSSVEGQHRYWEPGGPSGFFRLRVPPSYLTPGQPLRLRVDLPPPSPQYVAHFFVSPRAALPVSLRKLRDEVAQLQRDLITVRLALERLTVGQQPELFPERIRGEGVILIQNDLKHYHPPNLTRLRNGDLLLTAREGTDHVSRDGRIVMLRSRDGGRSWSRPEVMLDLGQADHRASPITELPNGDWVSYDYRAKANYTPAGTYHYDPKDATLWGMWSTDQGRTWQFTSQPLTVPGHPAYAEAERPIIRLRSGALLLAAGFVEKGRAAYENSLAIFRSEDHGRSWNHLATIPPGPYVLHGEPAILQTQSGKIILLARSGGPGIQHSCLYQSDSLDEGRTWSPIRPTPLSCLASPGHLIELSDGRVLCSHASRSYPISIYLTVSPDDGTTWDVDRTRVVANDIANWDSCYPTTAELSDGHLFTVWYANLFGKYYVAGLRYPIRELT